MNKKKIITISLVSFFSIIIPLLIEKYKYPLEQFSCFRFFIILLILAFIGTFFIFDRKKECEFIYKKRYFIGIGIFTILVLFGFHGSSVSIYNDIIQPNYSVKGGEPIVGQERTIRGDEWAVSTPTTLSQSHNNFNIKSNILTATNRNITLYPKIVAKDISVIATPNNIGFLFLDLERAFSFYWYFGYFLLFFSTFELFMIITKKKFYSLIGAILITFSPVVQWWESWNIVAYGELAIIFFNMFLNEKKLFKSILYSILIGLCGCCYIMCLYPAWLIPYGYFFLILVIWLLLKNKGNYKISKVIWLVLVVFAIIACVIIPLFMKSYNIYELISNTSYPGKRFILGEENFSKLFNYFVSIFCFYRESFNSCEMAQFVSLYPIPIIMAFKYILKKDKIGNKNNANKFLLIGLSILAICLSIWNFIELPKIIAKLTFIYMSTPSRCSIVVSYICIFILIICLSNYSSKKKVKGLSYENFIISFIISLVGIYLMKNNYSEYIKNYMMIFDLLFYTAIMFAFMLNYDKYNKIAISILSLIVLFSGILVHPLNRGLKVIYDKPFSKEIKKIIDKDKKAKWATISTPYYIQNYLVANGAPTINSTNYYPNDKLWKKLDLNKKDKNIYNRYAHITIDLTEDKTNVDIMYEDHINLNLNVSDVCKLNIEYLVTNGKEIEEKSNDDVTFKEIYNKDGILIYNAKCS